MYFFKRLTFQDCLDMHIRRENYANLSKENKKKVDALVKIEVAAWGGIGDFLIKNGAAQEIK